MPLPHFLTLGRLAISSTKQSQFLLHSNKTFKYSNAHLHKVFFASQSHDHSLSDKKHGTAPPTNYYHITDSHGHDAAEHHGEDSSHADEHHGGPRDHLNKDGTVHWGLSSDHFHWYDPYRGSPPQYTETVNGVKMIKGVETRPLDELYAVSQENLPFWPRTKLNFWGNHALGLKIEFLFFWIPTIIIASLAIPCLTMIYMNEESINSTMTIKVIGRQWYWIYEVESPPEEEDEE